MANKDDKDDIAQDKEKNHRFFLALLQRNRSLTNSEDECQRRKQAGVGGSGS